MKLSTKGRYGLRFMIQLAVLYDKGPVSLKQIGEKQGISNKYLEQIVNQLNKAELVRSIRGAQGGYVISKSPSEITAGDILRVTEGSLSFVDCVENKEYCDKACDCPAAYVWKKISDAVSDVVDSITLEELTDLAKKCKDSDYGI